MQYREGIAIEIGLTQRNPDARSEVLMGAKLNRYSLCETYLKQHYGVDFDAEKQVCFGSANSQPVGTCEGDSGGPLIAQKIDGVCLIAVSTFVCGASDNPTFPSVFSRADYFHKWIKDTILYMFIDSRFIIM